MAQAGTAQAALRPFAPLHEYLHRLRPRLNQAIPDPPTKAAPVSHEMQSFQQAGLARPVFTGNQVQAITGNQFYVAQAP